MHEKIMNAYKIEEHNWECDRVRGLILSLVLSCLCVQRNIEQTFL